MTPNRLSMTGIRKAFGPTIALGGVDLELRPSEIHALVGENGAGKSTLMKILSGAERPDDGSMSLDGRPYAPTGPADARRRGVVMVYQELTLAPHLTVGENVLLGQERTFLGLLRHDDEIARTQEALAQLRHPEIRPETPVARLSPAARQLVEIARAFIADVRLLVLDEPTQALNREDAARLFELVRRLRDKGVSVVYISHFLEEVEALADRYAVLRDGKTAGSGARSEFDRGRVIEQMVGRALAEQYPRVPHTVGEPILELSNVTGERLPHDASLTLHRGEIFGLAGMLGAGRTELLRAVFALDPVKSGTVRVRTNRHGGDSPRGRIQQGLGLLSEDRQREGLALGQSLADNLTYSRLRPYRLLGILELGKRRRAVERWLERLGIRSRGPGQPAAELSGGNQQKLALGRLLHQEADVLLLDEPTRGVDVGSKAEIYRLIGELAAQGKAVLLVSSYLPELQGACDRIAVMTRGRLGPARLAADWTAEQIIAAATGV